MTIKTIVTCTVCGCAISETPERHPLVISINGWPMFDEVQGEFCTWGHASAWFEDMMRHLGRE